MEVLNVDYREYYDSERYLFETVHRRFHAQGRLCAFDFFCIVIWKANRAKSKIAKRLKERKGQSLADAVLELTTGIAKQATPKDRLHYLWSDAE